MDVLCVARRNGECFPIRLVCGYDAVSACRLVCISTLLPGGGLCHLARPTILSVDPPISPTLGPYVVAFSRKRILGAGSYEFHVLGSRRECEMLEKFAWSYQQHARQVRGLLHVFSQKELFDVLARGNVSRLKRIQELVFRLHLLLCVPQPRSAREINRLLLVDTEEFAREVLVA